eukprot:COSAG02_NODE_2217_length_9480_cov_4.455922_12_plen_266_part_00
MQGNHTFCTGPTVPCPSWLWHNGTGILLTNNSQPLEVNVTNRTGNFAHLTAHATATAALSRTLDTFSVRILHGEAPKKSSASAKGSSEYMYTMYPSAFVEDMATKPHAQGSPYMYHVNTASMQVASVCGGPSTYSSASQLHVVFWPSGGGAPSATAQVDECILGASSAIVRASLPSIILLRRANATGVTLTASGVDTGGPLTITLEGVALRCSADARAAGNSVVSSTMTNITSTTPLTTVELALPTQQSLIGKSVTVVCTAAVEM